MRGWLTLVFAGVIGCGGMLGACGGATASSITSSGDSGSDAAGGDAGLVPDGSSGSDATQGNDAGDGGTTSDTGTPCAPPTDPSKSALCLTLVPEDITFTSDPKFDGKGWLVAQVFDTSLPDLPDGGEGPALQTIEVPSGGPDAGPGVDLSQAVPMLRFDGLPSTVYARAIFVDDPAPNPTIEASTWLAGYDLSKGFKTSTPLVAQSLPTGAGTSVSLELVALREMSVTMNRTVAPAGNGEGPASVVATGDQTPSTISSIFGLGTSPCARVDGTNTAEVTGFVIGKGPYYVVGIVDDFGLGDAGVSLPPGALVSLDVTDAGLQIPAADLMTYPATAYRVSQTISLDLVLPGAPATDMVSCP
jgi:hypothetical protein